MKFYAGIGSRETPKDILERMTRCARHMNKLGYTLRSGGAEGADRAFEKGCGDRKQIFTAKEKQHMWTEIFVEYFHPNPRALKAYPYKLMQRNAKQILGEDGNTPVDFVVCYTPDGKMSGGTGQALRIAHHFNIRIFNFYFDNDIEKLKEYVRCK